jgi:uncharacterized membrane protein YkvA (DUF1232 family)
VSAPGRFVRLFRAANAVRLATYLVALWKLARHPETPRGAKFVALVVLAYAVSPIDLIPDFIPLLGQLDDLIIVPLGVALVVRMTPKPHWEARLCEAEASTEKLPRLWWGAVLIVLVWAVLFALFVGWLARLVAAA